MRDEIRNIEIVNDKIFIVGNTFSSTNIATTGSFQEQHSGSLPCPNCGVLNFVTDSPNCNKFDTFFAQFDLDGHRNWGSYYGGDRQDLIDNILVQNNSIYLFRETSSDNNIASANGFRSTRNVGPGTSDGTVNDKPTVNPFIVKFDSGVLDTKQNNQDLVEVYPNPTSNSITISGNDTINQIEVVSLLGQVVINKQINEVQTIVDLSSLGQGIYLLKIYSSEGQKVVKVCKNNFNF